MAKILIIDDDRSFCNLLKKQVRAMGHKAGVAHTLADARKAVASGGFDVVYLDVHMPDGNGLDLLPDLRKAEFSPEVIIVTGQGAPDGAELAIQCDAWDYIQKGDSFDTIVQPLEHALKYREELLASGAPIDFDPLGIMGHGKAITNCLEQAAKAAMSDAAALITGETGTGKELLARAVHHNSPRTSGPFVVVDCAALMETLAESTLFGHRKGAFTGAAENRKGLIKLADGGTLFLDEIGELEPQLQKTFLRCLESRAFRPVGSLSEESSDFRLIAATNRDLEAMVRNGAFRKDLLFRLSSLPIKIPPLRERKEDIGEIAWFHMEAICERMGLEAKVFSSEFFDTLTAYDWPGNVRELVNSLEAAVANARNEQTLFSKHLPTSLRIKVARASVKQEKPNENTAGLPPGISEYPEMKEYRKEIVSKGEKEYITDLLRKTAGDITEACRVSGLSRSQLFYLRKKHGLLG